MHLFDPRHVLLTQAGLTGVFIEDFIMTNLRNILTGAAGVAMIAATAAPAVAQSVPYSGYNQGYNNQGYNGQGGTVGAVINSVLGGGRYGAYGQGNDRVAVDQCARAAEARVSRDYRTNGYGAYPQNYNGPRYPNQGYANNGNAMARVVGITSVERRSNGLKITGVIDSGRSHRYSNGIGYGNQNYSNQGYGNQAYGYNAQADLRFTCRTDYRGYVTNVDISRNGGRRG